MKRLIDGKTILVIEVETRKAMKPPGSDTEEKIAFLVKSDSIVDKKWMDKEELKEKHLVAAIKNKEPIPTPDVITVSEEIHEKLYPANYKRPKWRILSEREYRTILVASKSTIFIEFLIFSYSRYCWVRLGQWRSLLPR